MGASGDRVRLASTGSIPAVSANVKKEENENEIPVRVPNMTLRADSVLVHGTSHKPDCGWLVAGEGRPPSFLAAGSGL